MALPCNQASITHDYYHVYQYDPAFDRGGTGKDGKPDEKAQAWKKAWKQYEQDGDWRALPMVEGEEPTVFRLRQVTGEARADVIQLLKAGEYDVAGVRAARYALVAVDNWAIPDEKGDPNPVVITPWIDPKTRHPMVRASEMAWLLAAHEPAVMDCGAKAIQRMMQPDPT